MSLPSWVRRGVECVCIDDAWNNTFDIPSEGPHPKRGDHFIVADTIELLGVWYITVAEPHVAPDYYAVSGFRGLTAAEIAVSALWKRWLKAAVGQSAAELEPAL